MPSNFHHFPQQNVATSNFQENFVSNLQNQPEKYFTYAESNSNFIASTAEEEHLQEIMDYNQTNNGHPYVTPTENYVVVEYPQKINNNTEVETYVLSNNNAMIYNENVQLLEDRRIKTQRLQTGDHLVQVPPNTFVLQVNFELFC